MTFFCFLSSDLLCVSLGSVDYCRGNHEWWIGTVDLYMLPNNIWIWIFKPDCTYIGKWNVREQEKPFLLLQDHFLNFLFTILSPSEPDMSPKERKGHSPSTKKEVPAALMCSACLISSMFFQGSSIIFPLIGSLSVTELYSLANAELSSCANDLERDGCKFNCSN